MKIIVLMLFVAWLIWVVEAPTPDHRRGRIMILESGSRLVFKSLLKGMAAIAMLYAIAALVWPF